MIVGTSNILLHSFYCILLCVDSEKCHCESMEQVALENAKEPGDVRDTGLIPGMGRSPGGGLATHCSILTWRIPRTEDPVGYDP